MKNPWSLYDALIEDIPASLKVEECIFGLHWTWLRAEDRVGIAMTFQGSSISGLTDGPIVGKPLRDVAAGMRSWDMLQASAGVAACNAWYNHPSKMHELGLDSDEQTGAGGSVFQEPAEALRGKKVAVIGHFPYIEKQLGGICSLSVLEREPEGRDYLDSACEYLLPEQDCVYITGMTLTNKTLPRLLELCQNAKTVLVGPSSPLTAKLFDFGVDAVAGFYVTDPDCARALVSQAAHTEIFRSGRRVTLEKRTAG